jgi:hypothetical protein
VFTWNLIYVNSTENIFPEGIVNLLLKTNNVKILFMVFRTYKYESKNDSRKIKTRRENSNLM